VAGPWNQWQVLGTSGTSLEPVAGSLPCTRPLAHFGVREKEPGNKEGPELEPLSASHLRTKLQAPSPARDHWRTFGVREKEPGNKEGPELEPLSASHLNTLQKKCMLPPSHTTTGALLGQGRRGQGIMIAVS